MTDDQALLDERAKYEKCRDETYETLNKDQAEYDKQLLTLSAAFLGVSLAFIKDVVPLKDATHLWVLYTAVSFLFACVLFVLGTFQYSIHGHLQLADYYKFKKKSLDSPDNEKEAENKKLESRLNWLERRAVDIKYANWVSGIFFILGTVLLIIFVTTNIQKEANLLQSSVPINTKLIDQLDGNLTDTSKTIILSEH